MINVLIVEASSAEQTLLIHILSADAQICVVGIVPDGAAALDAVRRYQPDVIVMALHLPKMNGLEVTRRIMETDPRPIIVMSGNNNPEVTKDTFDAMEVGALAVLPRLVGVDHLDHETAVQALVQTVKLMSEIKVVRRWPRRLVLPITRAVDAKLPVAPARMRIVAIGASTGGPPALHTLLAALPRTFPVPLLIVQHMAVGFIQGFVDWLGQSSSLPVQMAKQGDRLLAGHIYVAPDGHQMMINHMDRIVLTQDDPENGLRPSVSYLFRSVNAVYDSAAVAILLSGMGRDGADELALLREKGAITIAQDKASSVVHGMPGEAIKLDAARYILPPEEIASVLVTLVSDGGSNANGVT
ncbi:MAG: chemotaxis-specific protein-glutamate methyltransferase CheB [Halothiobacillus sp.]